MLRLAFRSSCRIRSFSTSSSVPRSNLRNVAIIAHVDHGKTTLVDRLLESSSSRFRTEDADNVERLMDSNPLEKERGITILSKYTTMSWQDKKKNAKFQFNIVDTPGHSDFGGEVERIMKMVDGVAVVIDATEGPMTQTKFVLSKALQHGLLPVVVVNKVDRVTSRIGSVENEIFDLFVTLGANDNQLDYPVIYASAKEGWAVRDLALAEHVLPQRGLSKEATLKSQSKEKGNLNMDPLFDAIVERVPPPNADVKAPFQMLVTQLESIEHWGKGLIGRILSGKVAIGDLIKALDQDGKTIKEGKITRIFVRMGMNQVQVTEASAGEIVSITGLPEATVNSTLCAPSVKQPIKAPPVDPPTLLMGFTANTSPLSGREGDKVVKKEIFNRLLKEAETNVSMRCNLNAEQTVMDVHARGELQLAILIENMRREGFEIEVSPPEVVFKKGPKGETLEPIEEVVCDLEQKYASKVMDELSRRGGELKSFSQLADGRSRLIYSIPTRGLIGFAAQLRVETGGSAIFNHSFQSYVKLEGKVNRNPKGALISMEAGKATSYALSDIESRGVLFVSPGMEIYPGMIIGENSRGGDIQVNPCRAKKLTNVRSTGAADKNRLSPPSLMTLEKAIACVRDDEVIEVTPLSIRLRKREKDNKKVKK